jgi:hypothetical protein
MLDWIWEIWFWVDNTDIGAIGVLSNIKAQIQTPLAKKGFSFLPPTSILSVRRLRYLLTECILILPCVFSYGLVNKQI